MTAALRPELGPLPEAMQKLPIARGYPVPWFVAWIDGEPEFRVMDTAKFVLALKEHRCWVCGGRMGSFMAFTIGPMCAVNRVSSEPPAHRDCALYSAQNCPFLSRPHMHRREAGLPEGTSELGGIMIRRNPGVSMVWITKRYDLVRQAGTTPLFRIGDPAAEIRCFARGAPATAAELRESIASGLPILADAAQAEGPAAVAALGRQLDKACALLCIEPIALAAVAGNETAQVRVPATG